MTGWLRYCSIHTVVGISIFFAILNIYYTPRPWVFGHLVAMSVPKLGFCDRAHQAKTRREIKRLTFTVTCLYVHLVYVWVFRGHARQPFDRTRLRGRRSYLVASFKPEQTSQKYQRFSRVATRPANHVGRLYQNLEGASGVGPGGV